MSTRITLDNAAWLHAIDEAIELLSHPRELLEEIGAKLVSNAQIRFDIKRDPQGAAWAPISEATKEIYESDWFIARNPDFKNGIPGTLLERTRQLRQSLGANPADDTGVEIGTSRRVKGRREPFWEVGLLHEFGTVRMPRRGLLTADPKTGRLGDEDEADILNIVQSAIDGAFG